VVRLGRLLTLVVVAGACRATPAPPHLEGIRFEAIDLEAAAETGLDRAAAEAEARVALQAAGFLTTHGKPAYRARLALSGLAVGPAAGGAPALRILVRVEVGLTAVDGGEAARREEGTGEAEVGAGGPALAVRRAIGLAVGEAARSLRLALASEQKSVTALLADLESSDVRLRDYAIQELGDRRERRAVPGLVRRLKDGDRRVVDRAIGALEQIKDPSAVPALIELSRGTDAAVALRLVPVVGEIGGRDALGWLLTLEQAYPDPRVRAAATAALGELSRGPGGTSGPVSSK
jgi:hypothetical protein